MVSILSLISDSISLLSKLLGTVPHTPTTIGITVTLMSHKFPSAQERSKYLLLFLFSLVFILWSAGMAKSFIRWVLFFFLTLSPVFWPGLSDLFVSKNPREFYASLSAGRIMGSAGLWVLQDYGFCIYHLVLYSNTTLQHNSL